MFHLFLNIKVCTPRTFCDNSDSTIQIFVYSQQNSVRAYLKGRPVLPVVTTALILRFDVWHLENHTQKKIIVWNTLEGNQDQRLIILKSCHRMVGTESFGSVLSLLCQPEKSSAAGSAVPGRAEAWQLQTWLRDPPDKHLYRQLCFCTQKSIYSFSG